jgi:hypothetical protein
MKTSTQPVQTPFNLISSLSLPPSFSFLLTQEIDAVKVGYSPKWLKEHPAAIPTAL